ncbi:helix-turn-helix domain-containing protein [Sneathiella glossodoripedis]|uniref:helix-turn-helix domain-containing protein n=1 Tax=Sneathiella glossodoripedis TaxID=418853 RepID=UPI0004703320|nr:XRE family transcriptional regulator [Sneathiella glossodoripedis]
MQNPSDFLPGNLKKLRSVRQWSLTQAAEQTGVSKAMLGQIERGESSPTLATLWKIATGFGVSFSELVNVATPVKDKTRVVDSNLAKKAISDDGMLVSIIQDFDLALGFEWFEITFPAGYERQSAPHKKGVIEFISVLKGSLIMEFETEIKELSEGQSIRFQGDREHGYRNHTKQDTVVHCLMHYAGK